MNDSNALAIREEMSLAAYASGMQEKLEFCKVLYQSGTLPTSIKSHQAVFALMLMGQEYGFSPIKSVELFDFINGRAAMRAAAMMAKCIQHGGSFKLIKDEDSGCTLSATRTNRNGQVTWEETQTYTINDAQRAGLIGKDNWKKHPRDMCYARAASRLCRHGWADVLGGLQSLEELRDADAIDITPVGSTWDKKEISYTDTTQSEGPVVATTNPYAEPAVVEPEPEEKKELWHYDLNKDLRYQEDPEWKAKAVKVLKKHGEELSSGVWCVNQRFEALDNCQIQPGE